MRLWNRLAESVPIISNTSSSDQYPLCRRDLEIWVSCLSSSSNSDYTVLITAWTKESGLIYQALVLLDRSQYLQLIPRYYFGVSQGSVDTLIALSLFTYPISRINTVASCETVKKSSTQVHMYSQQGMPDVEAELLGLGSGRSTVVSVTVPLPAELLTYWGRGRQFLCIHTLRQANVGLNPIVRKVLARCSLNNSLELLVPYRARTMITHMSL